MAQITAEDQARVAPKLRLARDFVDSMNQQIKNLVTGGLTEAQSIEAEQGRTRRMWLYAELDQIQFKK